MIGLTQFPSRVESWLDVWELTVEDYNDSQTTAPPTVSLQPRWKPLFCVCREDERILSLFPSEQAALAEPSPAHISVCRLTSAPCTSGRLHDTDQSHLGIPASSSSPRVTASQSLNFASPDSFGLNDQIDADMTNSQQFQKKKKKLKFNPVRRFQKRFLGSSMKKLDESEPEERYASSTYLPAGILPNPVYAGYNQSAMSQYASQPYLTTTVAESGGQERLRNLKKRPSLPPSVNMPATKRSFSLSRLFQRRTKSTSKMEDSVDAFKSQGSLSFHSMESMTDGDNTLGQSVESLPQSLNFDTETEQEEEEEEEEDDQGPCHEAVRSISFQEPPRCRGETAAAAATTAPGGPISPSSSSAGANPRPGVERKRSQTTHFIATSSARSEAKQLPASRSAFPSQRQRKIHKNRRTLPVPSRWRGSGQVTDSSIYGSSAESIDRSQILTAFSATAAPPQSRSAHKTSRPRRHRRRGKEECPDEQQQQQCGEGKPASPPRHRTLRQTLFTRARKKADSAGCKQVPLRSTALEPLHCELTSNSVSVGRVHFSLAGGRRGCFFLTAPTWRNTGSGEPQRLMATYVFCAATEMQHNFWLKCLRRTVKPNLENERHRENSLFLSILEAKGLQNKRRYYCDVCLDRTLYARTTSKQAVDNSIFWAEEFDLNNLPEVSILTISVYRETEYAGRDGRRGIIVRSNSKKSLKKTQNRLVGFVTVPVGNLYSRNPTQTWLTLQPPTTGSTAVFHPHLNPPTDGSGPFLVDSTYPSSETPGTSKGSGAYSSDSRVNLQLRINARYKSVDVLPLSVYWPLHSLVLDNGIELAEWFEALLPVKLKEEVASCLVNLRERNGTVATFLSALVVNEVSALENESMTFRSNTMATKAVESYIKLVGKEYLHGLLHRYIQRVLACSDTWEVDPDKLPATSLSSGSLLSADGQGTAPAAAAIIRDYCAHKVSPIRSSSVGGGFGSNTLDTPQHSLAHLAVLSNGRLAQPGSLIFSQLKLLQHLDLVWETVRASRKDFPKQLLQVFSAFRAALQPTRGAEFCDKLVSACIFLRFICPAILTPSLFGLASTFPGESNCQRNLTLVAKSLQSLANLATFGDKEPFMRFMNAYVEVQIPVMREFLRDISSLDITADASAADCPSASVLSNHIDCGYELACLHVTCVEMFGSLAAKPPESRTQETGSSQTPPSTFPPVDPALTTLPPKLSHLPNIVMHIEDLKSGNEALDPTTTGLSPPTPPNLGYESRLGEPTVYAPVNHATRIHQGKASIAYAEFPAAQTVAPVPPRKNKPQAVEAVAPRTTYPQQSATLPRFFLSAEEEDEQQVTENLLTVSWAGLDRSVTLEPRFPLAVTESHQPERRTPIATVAATKSSPLRSNEPTVVGKPKATTSFSGAREGQASSEVHPEQRSPENKQSSSAVPVSIQPVIRPSRVLPSVPRTSETTSATVRGDTARITAQEERQLMAPARRSGAPAAVRPATTVTCIAIETAPRAGDVEGDYDDPYSEEHEPSPAVNLNGTSSSIPKSDAVILTGPYSGVLRSLDSSSSSGSEAARRTLSFPSPPSAFSLYRRPKPTSDPATTPTESPGIYKFVRVPALQREIPEEGGLLQSVAASDAKSKDPDPRSVVTASSSSNSSRVSAATHPVAQTSRNRDLDGRLNSATATRTSFPITTRSLDVVMAQQSSNSAIGSNPCTYGTAEVRQYPSRVSTATSTSSSGWSPIACVKENASAETSEPSRYTPTHHYPYRQAVNAAISSAAFNTPITSCDNQVLEFSRVPKRCSQQPELNSAAPTVSALDIQSTPDWRKNQIRVISTFSDYQPAAACSSGRQRGDPNSQQTLVKTLVTLTSGQTQRRPQQLNLAPSRVLQDETDPVPAATSLLGTRATKVADDPEAKVRRVVPSRLGSATTTSGRAAASSSTKLAAPARQPTPRTAAERIQPLVENEKMLSSTLEELGDAVAWLERERNDLLQQERLSRTPSRSSCHRQQSRRGSAGGAMSIGSMLSFGSPSKHSSLGTNTSVHSLNLTCQATEEPVSPRPQAPNTYQQYYSSAGGIPGGALTRSTNSLSSTDPMLSLNTPPPPATPALGGISRTSYFVSRSGSGSASPHRSRHSSGSSDRSYLTARSSLISRGSLKGERSRALGGSGFASQTTANTVGAAPTSFPRPSGFISRGSRIESMEALYNNSGSGSTHRLQPRNASASRSNCSLYSDRASNVCSFSRPSSDALSPGVLSREAHNYAVPSSPLIS